MSRVKHTALLGLVESDGEDLDILAGRPVAQKRKQETMPAAKRSRAPAGDKAAKPAPNATRRADERTSTAAARKPLTEKTTNAQKKSDKTRGKKRPLPEDIEGLDASAEDENDIDAQSKGGRGHRRGAKAAKLVADLEEPAIVEEAETAAARPAKRGRKPKAQVESSSAELEIPETQPPDADVTESRLVEMMDDDLEAEPVEDVPAFDRRGQLASASGPELKDSSLRRRIGEMARKYDSLEVKYKALREIGVVEAERNFDRLKKQGEERAKNANELIATLKAQLAAQTELAKEGQQLRQRLKARENEAAEMQDRIDQATSALADAKKEIKTLSTKLAASRAAEAASVTKVPGSAIKGSTANKQMLANAESAVQNAQLKEDLYADLTGLIIRAAKREKEEETYDCIQTGRNGTLHFKLSIETEDSVEDGEEPHFMYMPQLDQDRDRELIDLLPDYLVDEITFPRPQAAKFYHRVLKFLNEALE